MEEYTQHTIKIKNKNYKIHILKEIDSTIIDQIVAEYKEIMDTSDYIFPDSKLIFKTLCVRYLSSIEEVYQLSYLNTVLFAETYNRLGVIDKIFKLIPQEIINSVYLGLIKLSTSPYYSHMIAEIYKEFYKSIDTKIIPIEVYGKKFDVEFVTKVDEIHARAMIEEFKRDVYKIIEKNGDIKQAEYELLYGVLFIRYFSNLDNLIFVDGIETNLDFAEYLIDLGVYSKLLEGMTKDICKELKKYNTEEIKNINNNLNKSKKKSNTSIQDGRDIQDTYKSMSIDEILDILNIYITMRDAYNDKKAKNKIEEIKRYLSLRVKEVR